MQFNFLKNVRRDMHNATNNKNYTEKLWKFVFWFTVSTNAYYGKINETNIVSNTNIIC